MFQNRPDSNKDQDHAAQYGGFILEYKCYASPQLMGNDAADECTDKDDQAGQIRAD